MTITNLDRRDFLLMRTGHDGDTVVLSGEQLYMRYVAALFAYLLQDLQSVKRVRLIKTSWLADAELRRQLDVVFESFRQGGGRIEH